MKEVGNNIFVALIILVIIIFVSSETEAQTTKNGSSFASSVYVEKKYDFRFQNLHILSTPSLLDRQQFSLNPASFYQFDNLALFCKFEEKVARNSKIAMRLRLGSLDYVDNLENKPYTKTKK